MNVSSDRYSALPSSSSSVARAEKDGTTEKNEQPPPRRYFQTRRPHFLSRLLKGMAVSSSSRVDLPLDEHPNTGSTTVEDSTSFMKPAPDASSRILCHRPGGKTIPQPQDILMSGELLKLKSLVLKKSGFYLLRRDTRSLCHYREEPGSSHSTTLLAESSIAREDEIAVLDPVKFPLTFEWIRPTFHRKVRFQAPDVSAFQQWIKAFEWLMKPPPPPVADVPEQHPDVRYDDTRKAQESLFTRTSNQEEEEEEKVDTQTKITAPVHRPLRNRRSKGMVSYLYPGMDIDIQECLSSENHTPRQQLSSDLSFE